jgi:hypothetical protein
MRAVLVLVSLATFVLGAPCAAQTGSSHEVRIAVPTILRLRIDGGPTASLSEVPLAISVAGGVASLEPDRTRVQVLANTRWQLSAAFSPEGGSATLELGFVVDDRPVAWQGPNLVRVVLRGDATCGWREETIRYLLAAVPADGSYGGIITYTLTRP